MADYPWRTAAAVAPGSTLARVGLLPVTEGGVFPNPPPPPSPAPSSGLAGFLLSMGLAKPGPAPTAFSTSGAANNAAPWPPAPPTPPVATPFAPAGGLALGAPPPLPAPALASFAGPNDAPPYPGMVRAVAAAGERTPYPAWIAPPTSPPVTGPMPGEGSDRDPRAVAVTRAQPVGIHQGIAAPPVALGMPSVASAVPAGSQPNPVSPGSMAGGLAKGTIAPSPAAPARAPIEIVRGGVSDQGGGGLNLNQMRVLLSGNRPRITPSEGAMFQVLGVHESNREKALAQNEVNYQNLLRAASGNPDLLAKAEEARMTGASSAISEYLKAIKPVMGLGYSQANLFPDVAAAGFTQ